MTEHGKLGATYSANGQTHFVVWAPNASRVEVLFDGPKTRCCPLAPAERGYHVGVLSECNPNDRYRLRLDGSIVRPDPASCSQPDGVHGSSAIVDPAYPWTDRQWKGLPLGRFVLYELHVGTFTPEGTFAGVEKHLESLRELGVTAIELMPVAQFPGTRNWGYDGVYPFAVQNSYGGPHGLKHLVNAAHGAGLAMVLDVVYNHLGPEGNYLRDFGPYFTSKYQTPWGAALNFDGPHSDEVRRFFIENALQWVNEFHFDALRLDAVHAIVDESARPFLGELIDVVQHRATALGRSIHVIAETDANDSRICRSREPGGLGCDAQWSDDLHHALHVQLTGETKGYYSDFGKIEQVIGGLRDGYVFQGQYSAFRQRRHGSSPKDLASEQFVVCIQNHDQVGNRMMGDRLTTLVSFESVKLAAGVILLSPFIPLLFMGEEYGEMKPFQYFVDHSDPELIEAVRRGRREEFASFSWQSEPPDPQDESTFQRSTLDHTQGKTGRGAVLRNYYRELLKIRHSTRETWTSAKHEASLIPNSSVVYVKMRNAGNNMCVLLNFAEESTSVAPLPMERNGLIVLNSAEGRWAGPDQGEPVGEISSNQQIRLAPRSLLVISCQEVA